MVQPHPHLPNNPPSPNPRLSRSIPKAKGHLEPHISHLPRRPRPTQLPTPESDSSDDIPQSTSDSSSTSAESCSSTSLKSCHPSSHIQSRSPPPSTSSASSSPFARPYPHFYPSKRPHADAKGHVQPLISNIPRRPRPLQVLPGSGIYSMPPAIDCDDSGIPTVEFRHKGESRADLLARALFFLCSAEAEWHDGLVEDMYMRLHDLGMVPSPWMGALRREGLFVVEDELKRTMAPDSLSSGEESSGTNDLSPID